ncbi:hypothetical protein N9L68_06030 [bacterium]|nr:hypothetical protein [bacterium]
MGRKCFKALAADEQLCSINASVTDVDKPFLIVSQVVAGGSTVVFFSPKNCCIDSPGGRRTLVELQGNIYTLNLWGYHEPGGAFFAGRLRSCRNTPTETPTCGAGVD